MTMQLIMAPVKKRMQREPSIVEAVARRFTASSYPLLRDVVITTDLYGVALHGNVPSYYLKQVAQTIAMSVDGVNRLENKLVVY